ncbi:hypothetical protein ULMS_20910 [Patiriisocius marinistellae]|uniref:Uncharacterized protein n=1 Tax=Patiriisocius marinistellae TaxID=2494560 RepID=A0A5J4FX19_9FLAO|nr:choice-of-anchor I family protein [Patiriisocius marinistellae]GEQ86583.1 hypothetical protein ULMS_20910 [Patiriisocius marinistellae]
MKKITLLVLAFVGAISQAQVSTVAATSFEEPDVNTGMYTDTGDANTQHVLISNAGEPIINFVGTNEIGFNANYVPYDTPDVGLTDGDFVGVTDFTGNVGMFTDGANGYQLSDTDGTMTVEFDIVDFSGYINTTVKVDYHINDTGYEGDGTVNESGSDRMRIYVRDLTNMTEIDILNTTGSDINDLMIENTWITGLASVPANIQAQLVIEVRLNSGSEALTIDNILFEGEAVVATPQLEITEIFSGQAGTDLTADWFEIKNTGTVAYVAATDGDLFYDDESADPTTADAVQGITEIQPGATAIVLVTGDTSDITTFTNIWSQVIDLTGIQIGNTDGAGLGAGGDTVVLWLGDPATTRPIATGIYPDTAANDGQSYDVELSAFSVVGNANGAVETIELGGANSDVPNIGSPGNGLPATPLAFINFDTAYISVSEDAGLATVTLSISDTPTTNATIDVSLVAGGTALEGTDFTFAIVQTVIFPAGSNADQSFTIPLLNNTDDNSDVFFVVQAENATNASVGTNDLFSVYILDDDTVVPVGDSSQLDANFLTSYTVDEDGTAEIVAYDPINQQLFVVNAATINILDFNDPSNVSQIDFADITPVGASAQSVAVNGNLLAIAIANNDETGNGFVAFSDTLGNETPVIVEVGVLPDMLTFTPDETKLLVANEGQPNNDYTIDPEGTISIIDVSGGLSAIDQSNVTSVNFNAYNGQEVMLNANGIRVYGPNANASQDFEPEYIAISDDSATAYVALQENNAYAIIDIETATVIDIKTFGLKDHSFPQNSLDTSDETDFIFNASWPIKGMYMPDAIAFYSVGGVDYIVTANEGDAREYDAFEEEVNISDLNLNTTVFSTSEILNLGSNLGALNFSSASGDSDGDGFYEELHVFGGRSFSIFEAATGTLIYDSGNDFEVITAADPILGGIFNASNANNNPKNRSDNKGPEPEGVLVKEIDGEFYAFILLERIGGVMIYNVTDPAAPQYLQYINNREATPGGTEMGDLGPEGLVYVSAEESTTGTAYLVVANEVSATLSIISLDNVVLGTQDFIVTNNGFKIYPNPSNGTVFFNTPDTYMVYDMLGREIVKLKNVASMNTASMTAGTYIIKNSQGATQKLLVK